LSSDVAESLLQSRLSVLFPRAEIAYGSIAVLACALNARIDSRAAIARAADRARAGLQELDRARASDRALTLVRDVEQDLRLMLERVDEREPESDADPR